MNFETKLKEVSNSFSVEFRKLKISNIFSWISIALTIGAGAVFMIYATSFDIADDKRGRKILIIGFVTIAMIGLIAFISYLKRSKQKNKIMNNLLWNDSIEELYKLFFEENYHSANLELKSIEYGPQSGELRFILNGIKTVN